jgi:hypothetical protein
MSAEVVDLSARRHQIPITAPTADDPLDGRARNLAERARAIVAAKNLELPELKHRAWEQDERGMLIQCILAMRTDLSESSAFTCARDIEKGRITFEEVANGRPVDANRLLALQEAWKAAEAAYKTALEEECKRSGQKRMSVGHAVERARKRSHAERSKAEREKAYAEWFRLLDEAVQAKKGALEAVS